MKSLTKHIYRTGITSRADGFDDVFSMTVQYITGGMTAFKYQAELKPYLQSVGAPMSAKSFRLSLHSSRYSFSLRCWLLSFCRSQKNTRADARRIAQEWSVDMREDFACAMSLVESSPAFVRRLRKRARSSNWAIDARVFDNLYRDCYAQFEAHAKRVAYTRLRFIADGENLDLYNDLARALMERSVVSFFKLMPSDQSIEYVVNYVRRSMTNAAVNIIMAHTSQKSGRMVSTNKEHTQFMLRVVSENQLNSRAADGEEISYESLGSDDMTSFESEFSLTQIAEKYAHLKKRFRYLCIVMGQVDLEFTSWLQRRGHATKDDDNVDVQDRIPHVEYNRLLSQFLHIAEDKLNVFLLRVSKEMGHVQPREAA